MKSPVGLAIDLRNRLRLRAALRDGLRLGTNVRIIGKPDFGSEPYLIEIGNDVTVGSQVSFLTHDGATWVFRNRPEYRGLQLFGRICIGNNCFIGHRAIILPGVAIGDDCIVAAGAVVTRSVAPGHVVAGIPARVICSTHDYVTRSAVRGRRYAPSLAADWRRLKQLLLRELPQPEPAEGEARP